jgi:hypothetical protein
MKEKFAMIDLRKMRYHFLRDLTKDGVIELYHCRSEEQLSNIMTKPLKKLDSF